MIKIIEKIVKKFVKAKSQNDTPMLMIRNIHIQEMSISPLPTNSRLFIVGSRQPYRRKHPPNMFVIREL